MRLDGCCDGSSPPPAFIAVSTAGPSCSAVQAVRTDRAAVLAAVRPSACSVHCSYRLDQVAAFPACLVYLPCRRAGRQASKRQHGRRRVATAESQANRSTDSIHTSCACWLQRRYSSVRERERAGGRRGQIPFRWHGGSLGWGRVGQRSTNVVQCSAAWDGPSDCHKSLRSDSEGTNYPRDVGGGGCTLYFFFLLKFLLSLLFLFPLQAGSGCTATGTGTGFY